MQVSVSGQAVVFVVRTLKWSLASRAGLWTYIAFFLAQVSITLLAFLTARTQLFDFFHRTCLPASAHLVSFFPMWNDHIPAV